MGKWSPANFYNLFYQRIKGIGGEQTVKICVCSDQPTTKEEAESTYALAVATRQSADLVIVAGVKITIPMIESLDVSAPGDATHVAVTVANDLIVVTTCDTETLPENGKVTIPAWTVVLGAPADELDEQHQG
jgi:hypothetical protein